MEISTSNKFPKNSHTMEVSKGWKYHGHLLEVAMISMIWRGHDFSSVNVWNAVHINRFFNWLLLA